jgi:hypothetical protein
MAIVRVTMLGEGLGPALPSELGEGGISDFSKHDFKKKNLIFKLTP